MVGVEDVGRQVVVRSPQKYGSPSLVVRGWLVAVLETVVIVQVCETDKKGEGFTEFSEFYISWVRLEEWGEPG